MKPERWQHIDQLLGDALALDSSRRAAFLDQMCAGDEELRLKIDALLAAHAQAESFIETPALAAAARSLADEARFMVGRKLGHYQILALVGAGGMGAVWKARDTRLDRDVALKTLPEKFDGHADWLFRFEREAKLLASVSHSNIAAIYGLDEHQGRRFLVLEFIEGETLADRLSRGAIPLDESLKLARQISDALEAAHEKGIIHRDLKPANIKITADGSVKVLDFGLAKVFAEEASSSPSIEATERGIVLGTAAYMAPEQARGKRVDKRADIWAFGAVLYEMVTGTRAFPGMDATETMASVMMKNPDFDRAPAPVRRLLRKCLEKDPKNRLRDIGDAWELVDSPLEATAAPHPKTRRRDVLQWILASFLGVVAGVFSFGWLKPLPSPEPVKFQIYPSPGSRLPLGTPAISKDGRIAYRIVDPTGVIRIFVQKLGSDEEGKPLPRTEGALHLFWSPGGESLAFTVGPRLKRIDLAGPSVIDLTDSPIAPWQGDWNENDLIVVQGAARAASQLLLVPAQAGLPAPIPDSSDVYFPVFLRDSHRYVALTRSDKRSSIQLRALGSTKSETLLENVSGAPIVARRPDGKAYLLFPREANLMAQEFDEAEGKVLGKQMILVPNIGRAGYGGVRPTVGVSPDALAYQNANQEKRVSLKVVDRTGKVIRTFSQDASIIDPRLSPNQLLAAGTRAVGGPLDIWVTDLRRGISQRIASSNTREDKPVWAKDSSRLAFRMSPGGIYETDLQGKLKQLTPLAGGPTSWSSQHLAFNFQGQIHLLDNEGSRILSNKDSTSAGGEFSPKGDYIAFHWDKTGRDEVYVQRILPRVGEPERVSIDGGSLPRWKGNGEEIFFISPDGYLMSANTKLGNAISVGPPARLFSFNRDSYDAVTWGYDVFSDGQHFLIPFPTEEENVPITIVLNWWVQLKEQFGR